MNGLSEEQLDQLLDLGYEFCAEGIRSPDGRVVPVEDLLMALEGRTLPDPGPPRMPRHMSEPVWHSMDDGEIIEAEARIIENSDRFRDISGIFDHSKLTKEDQKYLVRRKCTIREDGIYDCEGNKASSKELAQVMNYREYALQPDEMENVGHSTKLEPLIFGRKKAARKKESKFVKRKG